MSESLIDRYWQTLGTGSPPERLAAAQAVLASDIPCASPPWYSACCVLLENEEIAAARAFLERALFNDFDGTHRTLLPLLAHVYQRQFDFANAHLLYSVCARLGLLAGQNQWAAAEDNRVTCGLAEHLYFSEIDTGRLHSLGVRSRALYELALTAPATAVATAAPRLPDFMIVGAAKCGSSFLYDLVCQSPDVWRREPKEIHYYTNYFNFGTPFYARFFTACPDGLRCGEASPDYFDVCNPQLENYADIAQRIHAVTPETRIIVTLRDPALRAVSLYNQIVTNKQGGGPRSGLLELQDLTLKKIERLNHGYCLKSGHYVVALRRFVQLFGRDRVLVLGFPELEDMPAVSAKVCAFLDIRAPQPEALDGLVTNAGKHAPPGKSLYRQLRRYYADSLAELAADFGLRL